VDAASGSPNLLPNSSFEAGIDHRYAMGRWYIHGLPSVLLDSGTKVHGSYSARLPMSRTALRTKPVEREGIVFRAAVPVEVQKGHEYSFSVYLRSDLVRRGKITITRNNAGEHQEKPLAAREIIVGRDWKRAGLTFKADVSGGLYWEINISSSEPGHVWVDALQFEQGGFTAYRPRLEVEAGLTSSRLGRIFTPPEAVTLVLRAFNDRDTGFEQKRFRMQVVDFGGTSVYADNIDLALPPRGGGEKNITLPVKRFGVYRAILHDADSGSAQGEISFSLLPPPRHVAAGESAFGAYLTLAPEALEIAQRLGFHWIASLTSNGRVTSWISVEPDPGRFLWYEEEIDDARNRGFEFMFNLEPCSMPKWAARLEAEKILSRWTDYVHRMAQQYSESVRYWTISDEAHHKKACWSDASGYARWHQKGHDAIKAVDPGAKILMNADAKFGEEALRTLPPDQVDVLAGNYYHVPDAVRHLRDVARRHDVRHVWVPGIGEWTPSFYPELALSIRRGPVTRDYWPGVLQRLSRGVVQSFAHGAERLFHYTATYVGNTNNYSLFDTDSGLKPTGAQFGALIWLLDGFTGATEIMVDGVEKSLYAYRVDRRDGNVIYAVWGLSSPRQEVVLSGLDAGGKAILYDHFANEAPLTQRGRQVSFNLDHQPVFLQLPQRLAPLADKAFRTASLRLRELPVAPSQIGAGRYAKLVGLDDGKDRNAPNVSLWYSARTQGWTELFRYRSSQYPVDYHVDETGITVDWDFVRSRDAFHIGLGQFPADLVQGAKYMGYMTRDGRKEWYAGNACQGRLHPVRSPAERKQIKQIVDLKLPHGLAFFMRNGLIVAVETELVGMAGELQAQSQLPGAWSIIKQGDACFLHAYYPVGKEGRMRVRSRIHVMETTPAVAKRNDITGKHDTSAIW
jgi:hypothetical protein